MSYKALLNAKAVSSMYSNTSYNAAGMASEIPAYSQGDDDLSHEEDDDDQEDYANGESSPVEERQGSGSVEPHSNIAERFQNYSLKRCRFGPRQDIELLKEVLELVKKPRISVKNPTISSTFLTCFLCSTDDKPYIHSGKASWESWGKIAHVLNSKQVSGRKIDR